MRDCKRALAILCLVAPLVDNAKAEGLTAEMVQKNLMQKALEENMAASFAKHMKERKEREKLRCGEWLSLWDEEQLDLDREDNSRTITHSRPPRGFGDNFSGILSSFWVAVLQRRRLYIHWPETKGVISWNGARPIELSDNQTKPTYSEFNGRKAGISHQFVKKILTDGFSIKDIVLYCNRGGTKVLWNKMILSNYELSQNALTRLKIPSPNLTDNNQTVGHQATNVAGCILHHLIQPTRQSYAKAHSIANQLENRHHICIQIRTGMLSWVRHWGRPDTEMLGKGTYRTATNDRPVENTTRFLNREQMTDVRHINYTVADASPFFSCAHDIESTFKLNNTLWYLTTDSESLREDTVRRYGNKIILMDDPPVASGAIPNSGLSPDTLSVSQDGMRQELAEWWLLSRCQHLIISYSGFGLTAAPIAQHVYEAHTYLISKKSDVARCSQPRHLDMSSERAGL